MKDYVYILAPISSWIVAQALKVTLELRKEAVDWSDAIASGGMPSAHTAGIVSLLTVIGIKLGIKDPLFALCFTLTGVVMYDAIGVRRTAGENALALEEIQKREKGLVRQQLHVALGHTPQQALAGAAVGVVVGLVLTKLL